MIIGTIKCFFHARSYGFIQPEGESEKLFVHETGLQDGAVIDEGDKVEFEVCEGGIRKLQLR